MTNTQKAVQYSINDYFITDVLTLAAQIMANDVTVSYHDALQQAKQTIGKGLPA